MRPPFPRSLRCAAAALACAAASSCGWFEPALQVHVTLDPAVRASCVEVSVFPSSDVSGAPADSRMVVRSPGKDEIFVGVYRGSLPGQVFVTARPLFGVECNDPLLPNGAAAVTSGTFPPSGFTQVDLALDAPAVAEDADGDGFVPAPNGADCNDSNTQIHPGATEHCQEPADYNCDGRMGCADPACAAVACLPSPTQLAFANGALSLTAGACSAVPVQVDTTSSTGAVVAVLVPTTVTLSAPDGNLNIFSDACITPATSFTIPAGRSRVTAYLSGTAAGSARLSASAPGLGTVEQTETIQPGALNQLVFTTAAQSAVPLNGCSEPVTVQLRDAYGNPTSAGTPLSLALTSDASPGSSFNFYPDAACANGAIGSAQVAAGANTATFYFKSTATSAGTVNITVTSGTRTASQAEGLVSRTPAQLVFPNAPVQTAQGACSPAVMLQTRDGAGQPAPVISNFSIPLSADSASVVFYGDAACATSTTSATIGASLSSTTFYFKGNQGTPTLTANGGALGSPQQTETITAPVAATQLAFATAAQMAVAAGACSGAVDIESRDSGGAAAPAGSATTVTLATNPSGQLSLYQGTGCTGPAITSTSIAAGSSRVTISFKGTLAATTDITASAAGLTSATQREGVVAAAGDRVLIVAGKGQTLSTTACGALTLERQDPYGNPTSGNNETMNLTSSPTSGIAFYGTSTCTGGPITTISLPGASQQVLAYFKGTAAGSYTLTEQPQSTLTGDTAPETITLAVPTELRFTSAAQSAVTAGACSAGVVLTTYDSSGAVAPVAGTTAVTVGTTGPAGVGLYADAACSVAATSVSIPAGSSSVTYYFKGNTAGSGTLTASATGLTSPTPQAFTIKAAAPAKLTFSLGPFTVAAGQCTGNTAPIAIQVQDAFGNPSPVPAPLTVNISASSAATTAPYTLSFNQNCNGSGLTSFQISTGSSTSSNIYFKSNGAGTWTITASASGLTSGTQDETVTALAPSQLAYLTAAQTLAANACSAPVTVQMQDSFGNPATAGGNTNISLAGSAGFFGDSLCSAISTTVVVVPAGQTNASFYFKAPATSGNYTITVSGVGNPVSQTENIL